jgi:hypothetical protein
MRYGMSSLLDLLMGPRSQVRKVGGIAQPGREKPPQLQAVGFLNSRHKALFAIWQQGFRARIDSPIGLEQSEGTKIGPSGSFI